MSRYIDADYVIKKIESRIGYFNQYYPDLIENIGELETCKDFINDAPTLENRMTTEKAINILYGMKAANLNLDDAYTKDKYEALDMAIKALEQTDGDLISRQAVIGIVEFECGEWKGLARTIVKEIEQLPSAEKTAEWISVRKQKPEDYEEVIATVRYDYKDKQEYEVVTGVRYSKEEGWEWAYEAGSDYWESINGVVVAWQPLPKPYEVKR